MSQTFSTDDVATHNTPDSLWIIIDQIVYDVTDFQKDHPGGKKVLQKLAGKDASKQFRKFHNEAESILLQYINDLRLGRLAVEQVAESLPPTALAAREITQPVTATA